MGRKYSKEELDKLHKTLYEILEEIIQTLITIMKNFLSGVQKLIGILFLMLKWTMTNLIGIFMRIDK